MTAFVSESSWHYISQLYRQNKITQPLATFCLYVWLIQYEGQQKVKENILLKQPTLLPHPGLATFKEKSQSTISLSPTITTNFPHPLKEKRQNSPSNCYVSSGGAELTLIDRSDFWNKNYVWSHYPYLRDWKILP